jgi:hypothetical protein
MPGHETPKETSDSITVRSYPKTMLMYPTMLASLIIALIETLLGPQWYAIDPSPFGLYWQMVWTLGFVWFFIFAWNMYILTFEFSKGVVAVLMALIIIIVLVIALVLAVTGIFIWIPLWQFFIYVDAYLLYWFTGFFLLLFLISWVSTRFFYFRITHNEIVYKKGLLGDSERFGTTDAHVHKEIRDLFEYFLFTSGRLTIIVSGRQYPIVIDNVPRINKVERKILDLLKVIDVK